MSDTTFHIHDFDASNLPLEHLKNLILTASDKENYSEAGWTISQVKQNATRTIYRLEPEERTQYPVLAAHHYIETQPGISRAFHAMQGLFDFGISLGPRPFYYDDHLLIVEWLHGEPLQRVPGQDEEDRWHRIMTVTGITSDLPFHKHTGTIPMQGRVPQNPGNLMAHHQALLNTLDTSLPVYDDIAQILESQRQKITPEWHKPAPVGLIRLDVEPHHFIWDGYHIRALGWENVDWGDKAYSIAWLAAHPDYEDLPGSHWVWFRWEYGRLTHQDSEIISRATVYTRMLQLTWALRLTQQLESDEHLTEKQRKQLTARRNRYLKRARSIL